MLSFFRARWRRKLAQRPFPDRWRGIVQAHLSFANRYDPEERQRFETHLKVFVWEKHWVGVKGVEITDEVKVVIAGQAARMSHNLSLDVYDRLSELVIYPSHYVHPDKDAIIYGEAHKWGTVVLSWDAVTHGLERPADGHDTAVHEFAHVLDVADGHFDGTPSLHEREDYRAWALVLSHHYAIRQRAPQRHRFLRAYGATNEAEFFAVATEAFFERPVRMRKEAPELYKAFEKFYRIDTAGLAKRGTKKRRAR